MPRNTISFERVRAVGLALSQVPLEAVEAIELRDPQFKAVRKIAESIGEKGLALVVANALVSYRLTARGEEYWLEFAEAAVGEGETPSDVVEFFKSFLPRSRGNRMLIEQKVRRLVRARSLLAKLAEKPHGYTDLAKLVADLSAVLGSRPFEKTIVFAAKMAYYFFKALGVEVKGKDAVPMPIDGRIALLTSTSRMVYEAPSRIVARPENAVKAWSEVSRVSGIPSLHLDALVWLPAAGVERELRRSLERARERFARNLYSYLGRAVPWSVVEEIAAQLLYDYPLT